MQTFPTEVFGVLGSKLELRDILALAATNTDFRKTFLDPEVNVQLAKHFGFPYKLNLFELEEYEKLEIYEKIYTAAKIGDTRIVRFIIKKYPKSYIFSEALSNAVIGGNVDTVKVLLEKSSLYSPDKLIYDIAMLYAAMSNHMDIMKLLIDYGANNFDTAMSIVILKGNEEMAKILLEKGADNYDNYISTAIEAGRPEIVELIKKYKEHKRR